MPLSTPLSLHDVTNPGNVLFADPAELERWQYPIPICGVHPFLVIEAGISADGTSFAHVVALTSKGSRTPGPEIPSRLLTGTNAFLSHRCFVYHRFYHWRVPAWILLEACRQRTHNLNRMLPQGVSLVRSLIA